MELDILSRHSGSVAGESQASTPRSCISAVSSVGNVPSTARGKWSYDVWKVMVHKLIGDAPCFIRDFMTKDADLTFRLDNHHLF